MVTHLPDGRTLFKAFLPHAAQVELIGTFTGWKRKPAAMQRHEMGWWSCALPIPAGEHEFCYLVDSCTYLADYAAHGVHLVPSGQWLSSLHVRSNEPAESLKVVPA
jgi:1,4-alpha-glucan branching enzyme